MRRPVIPALDQRGVALVVAVLVLVALSAIALTMMSTIISDRRLAGYDMLTSKALNNAEAGIAEALERIRRTDIPDTGNPKMVAQIFLASPGNVPTVGPDTLALATGQPVGKRIAYSAPTQGPDVLTIEYKTNTDRTKIYRYDPVGNPKVNLVKGSAVFRITAVGREGSARRKIVTEVVNPAFEPNLVGAVASLKSKVELKSATCAFGYDYKLATPTGTNSNCVRDGSWETGAADLPGARAVKSVRLSGTSASFGTPPYQEHQPRPYIGPWEVLGMPQSYFWDWLGDPNWDKKQGVPRGITYLDKPGGKLQDAKGKFQMKGGFNGDGFLYVNGDLEVNGDFTFRGLIYVEGEFKVHGSAWILGAIVAKKFHLHPRKSKGGKLNVLRSTEAVTYNIAKYASGFKTLTWREVDPNTTASVPPPPIE